MSHEDGKTHRKNKKRCLLQLKDDVGAYVACLIVKQMNKMNLVLLARELACADEVLALIWSFLRERWTSHDLAKTISRFGCDGG